MSKTTELEFQKGRLAIQKKEVATLNESIRLLEQKKIYALSEEVVITLKIKELENEV